MTDQAPEPFTVNVNGEDLIEWYRNRYGKDVFDLAIAECRSTVLARRVVELDAAIEASTHPAPPDRERHVDPGIFSTPDKDPSKREASSLLKGGVTGT